MNTLNIKKNAERIHGQNGDCIAKYFVLKDSFKFYEFQGENVLLWEKNPQPFIISVTLQGL